MPSRINEQRAGALGPRGSSGSLTATGLATDEGKREAAVAPAS